MTQEAKWKVCWKYGGSGNNLTQAYIWAYLVVLALTTRPLDQSQASLYYIIVFGVFDQGFKACRENKKMEALFALFWTWGKQIRTVSSSRFPSQATLLIVLSCFFTMLTTLSKITWKMSPRTTGFSYKACLAAFEKRSDSATKINGTQMAFN